MKNERRDFCVECRKEVGYEFVEKKINHMIKEKNYEFKITTAVCKECGEEMDVEGIMDLNIKEIDEQYRKVENIVSIDDIKTLMDIYCIGKAPLSLALGFGEITITRYLLGQVPSIAYSDIMKQVLQHPDVMKECLNRNRDKIGETAYKKSMNAANELSDLLNVSEKMLSTISYMFEKISEITPLALQKLLYYIQGLYMIKYNKPLFDEDCQAWIHGPVYKEVYDMFKSFQYNPIDDKRFILLRDRFKELDNDEKEVIDLVVDTFGMYSGKVLEEITHKEKPWINARRGYYVYENSNEIINKSDIKDYFESVLNEFDINTHDGINKYIKMQLIK